MQLKVELIARTEAEALNRTEGKVLAPKEPGGRDWSRMVRRLSLSSKRRRAGGRDWPLGESWVEK